MNFKILLLILSLGCMILLAGCDNCDTTDPRTTSYITIKIVDAKEKNLVNPSSGPYYPDSVKASVGDQGIFIFEKQEDASRTEIQYLCMPPFNREGTTRLYLHLNSQDTDTLIVSYKQVHPDCGGLYYDYTGFNFNGKHLSPGGILKLIK